MSTIHRTTTAEPVVGDVIRIRGSDWLVVDVREDGLSLSRFGAHDDLDAAENGQQARDGLAYGLGDTVVDGGG